MRRTAFLRKLSAAGVGVFMALSCAAVAACTPGESTHEHSWSSTWTSDGTNHWHTCSGCDEVDGRAAHTYGEWVVTTPATETADGEQTRECTVCGYEQTQTIPKLSHTHSWASAWTSDETGHWHACSGCDEKSEFAAHTYGEWEITTPPTTTEEGEQTRECTVCGYEDTQTIPVEEGSGTLPEGSEIYLVGDSTVCSFNDNYYMPRYGYGTQIVEYFNVTSDQVVNLAMSGRSSLSFLTEPNYTTLKNSIGEGDYLIIGFGHNDEKDDDAARFTNPNKDYDDTTIEGGPSFKYTLYENYIKLAKDAGATPILCTPIVRYSSSADYTGAKIHDTDIGDYSQAIRDLGEETDTTVIDLTTITKELYESDNEAAAMFHAHTTYEGEEPNETPAGRDDTHLNKYGAQMVAYQFATAIAETDNTLGNYVKDGISAPTDRTIAIKENYTKTPYTTPDLDNLTPIATIEGTNSVTGGAYTTTWYKTTMGDIGGNDKLPNFSTTYADDVFTVSNPGGCNGKFASSADGFTAAFMRVSKDDNFTITVTATLTSLEGLSSNPNQAGFGIMLRDDMHIDVFDNTVSSNYVTAGFLMDGHVLFNRASKTLTKGDSCAVPEAGDTYTMTISRLGQVVTVTVTDGTNTYTKTHTDYDFTAVDNDYMYICLFANRGMEVEYSNITFSYDGVAQGA